MNKFRRWTAQEDELLEKLYNQKDNNELGRVFNRHPDKVARRAGRLGMRKSPACISEMRRAIAIKNYSGGRPYMRGPLHPRWWKGGRFISQGRKQYEFTYCPDHPNAIGPGKKYVRTHRLVMEKKLGRLLLPKEVVHHRNGDTLDNRTFNLQLFSSDAEHRRHHEKLGWGVNRKR